MGASSVRGLLVTAAVTAVIAGLTPGRQDYLCRADDPSQSLRHRSRPTWTPKRPSPDGRPDAACSAEDGSGTFVEVRSAENEADGSASARPMPLEVVSSTASQTEERPCIDEPCPDQVAGEVSIPLVIEDPTGQPPLVLSSPDACNYDGSLYYPCWPQCTSLPLSGHRFWGRAEYLLWWTEGSRVPPLVTTSPTGTLQPDAGVLDNPETSILFGNSRVNDDTRSGGRFTLGYWLDMNQEFTVETSYLFIGSDTDRFSATSDGDPILARPFFNIEIGEENAHLVAFDPLLRGSVSASAATDFQFAELLLRRRVFVYQDGALIGYGQREWHLDLLVGYLFSRLDDDLRLEESFQTIGPTDVDSFDEFDTRNIFHGVQLGMATGLHRDRWSVDLLMKLGLGNSESTVLIDGGTTTTVGGGASSTAQGGLLALQTNIGRYSHSDFAIVPELGITLGFDLTEHLRATFGFTLIYWSRVARPGDQVDLDLNPTYFPNEGPPTGAPRPQFSLATTDFWAQGVNFGVECRF